MSATHNCCEFFSATSIQSLMRAFLDGDSEAAERLIDLFCPELKGLAAWHLNTHLFSRIHEVSYRVFG